MDGGGSQNYTKTKDPNVVIGKHGVPITRADFEHANKNGYSWKDFDAYADYVGGWAKPITNPTPVSPYYRAYGQQTNIPGADIAILQAKYADDPTVSKILNSNIAKPGEVPMYGATDADTIRQLVAREKLTAMGSHTPGGGLYTAMTDAKK